MNLPKHEINSLIADLLLMLKPGIEKIGVQKRGHTGLELILTGTKKTESGKDVNPSKNYVVKMPIMQEVNHERKLRKIIGDAKTDLQLENDLAAYVAKHKIDVNLLTGESQKLEKEKLSDYDILECPNECGTLCKPVKILNSGTVVYEKHECINEDNFSFRIDIEGNLVE